MKTLVEIAKTFLKGLIMPLIIGILLGTSDILHKPVNWIFPDKDSIGGVVLPLSAVDAAAAHAAQIDFVLVRQSMKPMMKIDFMSRGSARPGRIFAGISSDREGNAMPLVGGLNGMRFLELAIPASTLGGTGVMTDGGSAEPRAYVVTDETSVTKNLSDPNDLVVYTKNEARHITIVYWMVIISIAVAAFFVARSAPLKHPADIDPEAEQWT